MNARLFHLRHQVAKAKERAVMAVVWRLPRTIVYWSAIRLMADATTGKYSNTVVPELTAIDALERWNR